MSNFLQPHGLQHARLPCPSLSPRVCSNSCQSSQWCYPTISSRHRAQEMLAEWIHKCHVNLILLSFFINSDLHLGELKMKLGVQVSVIWFPPHLPIGKNAVQPLWIAFIHLGCIYTWIHRKAWGLQGPWSIVVMLPQQIVHLSFSEPQWLLIYQSLYTKNIHLSFAGTCFSQPWIFHNPLPSPCPVKNKSNIVSPSTFILAACTFQIIYPPVWRQTHRWMSLWLLDTVVSGVSEPFF